MKKKVVSTSEMNTFVEEDWKLIKLKWMGVAGARAGSYRYYE